MFAGYPLAGAPFAGDGQSNIAIEVTGVSASVSLGTVKTGISVEATPVTATASLASVIATAAANAPVTGVEAIGSVGDITVYLQKFVYPVGVQAANDVGTVEVDAKANLELTGVNATAYLGTVTAKANADVIETGFELTTAVGSVEVDAKGVATVSGVVGTTIQSGVTIQSDNIISVTGFQLNTGLGDEGVRIDTTVELGTLYAYGEVGTVDPDAKATVYVTGVSATCRTSTPLVWGIIDTSQNPNWVPIAA